MKANQGRSRWEQHFYSTQMEKPLPGDTNLMSKVSESTIGNEGEAKVPPSFQNEVCDRSGTESKTNKIISNILNDNGTLQINGNHHVETVSAETSMNCEPTMQFGLKQSFCNLDYAPKIFTQRRSRYRDIAQPRRNIQPSYRDQSQRSASSLLSHYDERSELSSEDNQSEIFRPSHGYKMDKTENNNDEIENEARLRQRLPDQNKDEITSKLVGHLAAAIREAGWGNNKKVTPPEKFDLRSDIAFSKFIEKFEQYCYHEVSQDKDDWSKELEKFLKGEILDGYKDIKKGVRTYDALVNTLEAWYKRRRVSRTESKRNTFHEATLSANESAYNYAVRLEA